MLRFFKKLTHNGNGSYSNEIATMKVVKNGKACVIVPVIKKMTGRSPDLEIEFKKENLTGFVWYKEK